MKRKEEDGGRRKVEEREGEEILWVGDVCFEGDELGRMLCKEIRKEDGIGR